MKVTDIKHTTFFSKHAAEQLAEASRLAALGFIHEAASLAKAASNDLSYLSSCVRIDKELSLFARNVKA